MLFQCITMLGEETFMLLVFGWIYWNYDKEKGLFIGYAAFASVVVNGGIKDLFKAQRPIGQPGIRTLRRETATGYSFPSGHSQAVAALGMSACLAMKKRWIAILTALVLPLVALSRLYLGVHYPRDVVAGLFLGCLIALLCHWLYQTFANRLLLFLLTFLALLPILLVAGSEDTYKALAAFGGFVAGAFFEERFVNFSTRNSRGKKWRRYLLGLFFLLAVKKGLALLMPTGLPSLLAMYFFIGFVGIGLYPWLFKKMGL